MNPPLDPEALDDLLRGIAAAPPLPPEDWLPLVGRGLAADARERTLARYDELAAETHGLTGEPSDPSRLAALRAELAARGLDGFIVPRGDEHQGEYVAKRSERLEWLTGFSGSAGLAVVLKEHAAVFVDGRYTLQAEHEVDGALFERCHLITRPANAWIADHLSPGAKLGFDPWLLTADQVGRFKKACTQAGGALAPVDGNPLDAVWADQPPPPLAPVVPLDFAFAGESSAAKRKRLAKDLEDAVLLTAPDSIAWLLNVRGGDVPFTPFPLSFAVLQGDGRVEWYVDARKLTPAVRDHLDDAVSVHDPAEIGSGLDDLGAAKSVVRVDLASAPAWASERLKAAGAIIERGADPCQLAKAIKVPEQVDGMRKAHVRDGAAVCRFLAWLDAEAPKGGVSEMAAADYLEGLRRENEHFRGLSFPTISGAGPNGAVVHYRVSDKTNRELDQDSLFLVDSGAQYLDGTTDITRTIAIGSPSDDMRRHFTLVLKGHISLATAVFPDGTTGSQLDVLARAPLWQAGLDYDHGTGHGVGSYLSVHEGPHRITKAGNTVALKPGMVVSNEPGFYREGQYGIRIENLVAVIALDAPAGAEREIYGFETLTLAPLDRRLIDLPLLSSAERDWLNTYHARVRETLLPLVDAATAAWLTDATAAFADGS